MSHTAPIPDVTGHALGQGQAALAAGDHAAASRHLRSALLDPVQRLAAHNLIERHGLADNFTAWMGCNCEIAPADDIFRFFANHPASTNPLRDYLADGWRTMAELMLLLEAVRRPLLGMESVLEFASGHGRFTRHLVRALGAQRVTVSDVVQDAVDFAARTFGVQGLISSSNPHALAAPRRYELVFVLSLFSHLPASTWGAWLRRLFGLLEPGGLLVFTTHGLDAVRRQGVTLDAEGFFFAPASESLAIGAEEYGTAFTSPDFVRSAIRREAGADALIHWAPTSFWNHQDAFVLQAPH